jgi:hypothetical protein
VHNFYTIETEAELYRLERERAAAADARAAQASRGNRSRRRLGLPSLSFTRLPALALPQMPAGAPLELRVRQETECVMDANSLFVALATLIVLAVTSLGYRAESR